jgi:hypothetical protein
MNNSALEELRGKPPRLRGIYEHFERSEWFLQLGKDSTDKVARFRFLLAGVYSARALVEVMLEAANRQEVKNCRRPNPQDSRTAFEATIAPNLPHYHLIEAIRIHDLHRFGCIPPDPNVNRVFLGGPFKLIAQKGAAVVQVSSAGPANEVSGQSKVKEQRPLCQEDDRFFDANSHQYLGLDEILERFLTSGRAVIVQFEELVAASPHPDCQ